MAGREDKVVSLVLSIFKGENFVCQDTSGYKCQIEAKCRGNALQSGIINIYSSNSEPTFNFQLAWQFTRRELKEIRGNKEAVKIRCLLINECSKATEIGYVVLYVKDAFPLSAIDENDPLKAQCYPLLGTKDQWKTYRPKLFMQLHLEEHLQSKQVIVSPKENAEYLSPTKMKPTNPSSTTKDKRPSVTDFIDSAPKMQLIPKAMTDEKFPWNINGEEGCFELGTLSDSDDLYILNITIISASYLHALWNGRSPKKASTDEYVWQVKYKAYGCEIKSDPFILSHDDDASRRTFIGDKATARIRANAALFYEYLQDTSLEFQVVRFQLAQNSELINEEVMGVSFAELRDLGRHDLSELKTTLEIVSEWGYPRVVSPADKPEVRVVFQLDAIPGFFSTRRLSENDEKMNLASESSKGYGPKEDQTERLKNIDCPKNNLAASESRQHDENVSSIDDIMREIQELEIKDKTSMKEQRHCVNTTTTKAVQEGTSKESKQRFEGDEIDGHNEKMHDPGKCLHSEPSSLGSKRAVKEYDPESSSASSSSNTSDRSKPNLTQSDSLTSPEKEVSSLKYDISSSPSSSNSETSDKENLKAVLPSPGKYKVQIGLTRFWIKRKNPIKEEFLLSYIHPKFGIKDDEFLCLAKPAAEIRAKKPHYRCIMVEDGLNVMEIFFEKFSERIINEPLTVDFRKQTNGQLEPPFAFCMIPVGRALVQQEIKGQRTLKGCAEILKAASNVKIGTLDYFVEFESIASYEAPLRRPSNRIASDRPFSHKNQKTEDYFPREVTEIMSQHQAEPSDQDDMPSNVNSAFVFQTMEELAMWKLDQEKVYKRKREEKERAYLRILSEEAAKREKEREETWTEKIAEFKRKEKSLDQQSRRVSELEERLKSKELEIANSTQKAALNHSSILENAKLSIRRMQEEHQIELSSLHRRNAEHEADLEKLRGKLLVYERQLEEKEEYIRKQMSEKQERPDIRLSEKYKLLEQENKLLKKQIIETERSRDQYKKQSQSLCHKLARLQEERDKQLKDENENLRLQIFASKEHKEMKKERKAVADLSETIRNLQGTAKSKDQENSLKARISEGQFTNKRQRSSVGNNACAKTDEIERLTKEKNGLLSTGAYTKYDSVIKEMERKIVSIAQEDRDREQQCP